MLVEIWSDVICPWCYIGKRRFEAALEEFEHSDDVDVRWRSFELDPRAPFRRSGRMAEHIAAKYGMSIDQAEERLRYLNKTASDEGLDFDLAHTQPGNTFDAHRLIHLGYSKDESTGTAVKEALLKAYFTDLEPISEPEVLLAVGIGAGLDPSEVKEMLESDRHAEDVRHDEVEAAALGCTGVPFFVIDRAFAVPGAQDRDTFLTVLRRAWDRSHPALEVLVDGGEACTDEACPI